MQPKWFWGAVDSRADFEKYVGSLKYLDLIATHPLELQEMAREALFFADKLKATIPSYWQGMSDNPIVFTEEAISNGLEISDSEITKLNSEKGTEYRNMLEYYASLSEHIKPAVPSTVPDPIAVIASEDDEYFESLLKD